MAETTFSKRVLPRLSDGSKGLSADFCKPIQLRAPYGSTDSRAHGSRNLSAPRPGHAPRWTTGPTASARVKTRLTARTRASVSISLRRTPVVQHGRGRAPSPARWRRSLEPSSPVGPKARSRVPLRTNHLVQRPFPAGASLPRFGVFCRVEDAVLPSGAPCRSAVAFRLERSQNRLRRRLVKSVGFAGSRRLPSTNASPSFRCYSQQITSLPATFTRLCHRGPASTLSFARLSLLAHRQASASES